MTEYLLIMNVMIVISKLFAGVIHISVKVSNLEEHLDLQEAPGNSDNVFSIGNSAAVGKCFKACLRGAATYIFFSEAILFKFFLCPDSW